MNIKNRVNLGILTYNRLDLTKQCIPNVRKTASSNIPYQITVVDNGSTDGSREYLKELLNQGIINHLILLKENIGVSKGSNLAWKSFDDIEIFAKIDNDVVFNKENWLDDIVHVLDNAPEIGALGYNCEGKNMYPVVDNQKVSYRHKGGNIGGACHFIPLHVKEKLGYWNEGFDLYGEEDADYGMRIIFSGLRNAYMVDETVMDHLPEPQNEYTAFKAKQRHDNFCGLWDRIMGEYRDGRRPLKVETQVVNEVKERNLILFEGSL